MTENATNYSEERIFPIPKLPDEIKDAVNREELVVFIGAGVSRLIGCKGWSDLANELVNVCFNESCINYKEKETLTQELNPKKKISICQHVLHEHNKDKIFFETISKSLQADSVKAERFPIYRELYKLRAIYVTTNMDEYFDNLYFKDLIVCKPQDFDGDNVDRARLYHLHGTISDPKSMILTTRGYLEHYNNTNIVRFLRNLFLNYTVMFVGYGMEEFEVLDFLLTKTIGPEKARRFFILSPMFRGEGNILAFERFYYRDLGTEVIPYAIDERGYDQLYFVIENWQKEINLSSTFLHDSFDKIEKNIDHYDSETAEQILQLIKNDPPLEDHFFRKLVSIEWLLPLKKLGYFDPKNNPKPRSTEKKGYCTIPHWNVLHYLEKVSEQVTEASDSNYAQTLIEILHSVSDYKGENGKPIDNYRTNWVFVKILANLPVSYVKIEDIELIRSFLDSKWNTSLVASEIGKSLLPKLLKQQQKQKALRLLGIVTSVRWVGENGREFEPLIEEYWLNELLKNNKSDLSNLYPLEAVRIIIENMQEIIAKKKSEFNVAWIPAIEDHPQNLFPDRFQNALVRMARYLLIAATEKNAKETKKLLSELLKQEHPIFRRFSLSTIDQNWLVFSDLFFSFASRQIFTDYNLRHEVYTLLKRHYDSFPGNMKDELLKWIEEGPDWEKKEEHEPLYEKQLAYWKQSWLSALLSSGYEPVTFLYEKYKNITETEPEHPDLIAVVETWTGTTSPIEVSELLQRTNEGIAKYLKSYKEDKKRWKAPSKEGLEDTLYKAVKSSPSKFDSKLVPFIEIPMSYQCRIIQGFRDAWKEGKRITWYNILDYCQRIISSEDFWKTKKETKSYYRKWLISQIADLLVEGTRDDTHAFNQNYLPTAEKIILSMLENTDSDLQYQDALITRTLNSAKGRVILALINYVLRVARLGKDKDTPVKWSKKIREEFSKRLDRNREPSLEWSVSLGEYLPQLSYLDESWVRENTNKIFLKESEDHWQAAMEGYLFTHRVYNQIYELLKEHGHYQKAIDTEFKNKDARKKLVHHLCILYLRDKENITDDDSLFRQCLNLWRLEDILEMISFFYMQRKYLLGNKSAEKNELENFRVECRKRILDFWSFIYGKLKEKTKFSSAEKRILSDISLLTRFLDHIDEEKMPWLKLSAEFVEQINTQFFIEELDRLCEYSPREVSIIFLTLLERNLIPYFPKEGIRSIVDKLYRSNERDNADRICNIYFSKGFELLRDIYEVNKKA